MGQLFENGNVKEYTIVLSTRDYRHIGQLSGIRGINNPNNLNSKNELSFSVCKYDLLSFTENTFINKEALLKEIEKLWNQIVDFKLVWVKELNEYFEIKVSLVDSAETIKNITATSLCEAELSQIETGILEINTEADILRDDYEITKFYVPNNPKASLLHRVFDKAPHYTIKHVDESLMNLQRTFSIDSTIYDFLIGECSEQFNCLFVFDTTDRSISVYDLYTVCLDCGEREEFFDKCPKCGSNNLKYFGEDTGILVDKTNLTESIELTTNADNIKNCFKLVAGDDLMTSTIRLVNPNGSDYIYYFSENQLNDMPFGLVSKLKSYEALTDFYTNEYKKIVNDFYDLTDNKLYLESSMMPKVKYVNIADVMSNNELKQGLVYIDNGKVYIYNGSALKEVKNADYITGINAPFVSAKEEAYKLNTTNLSPLGLTNVLDTDGFITTVNTALKNYAKTIVKSGYVKLDVSNDAKFSYVGKDKDGYDYGYWYGKFIVTSYSDKEDVAETIYLKIKVHNNFKDFLQQKVFKELEKTDNDGSLFDVLSIKNLDDFKMAISLYSLKRLESFYSAIEGAINVLAEANQGTKDAELYDDLYAPYYDKLVACQEELTLRQSQVNSVSSKLALKEQRISEIHSILDFKKYLGDYYNVFCSYRREQKYTNENFISDGLNNAELIKNADEFIKVAKKELIKSGETQFTITSTLYNLLAIPAFQPIVNKFKLGNWIRLRVDGQLYRLRLIGYTINFDNINNIEVQFSTVSKVRDAISEAQQIVQSASSMATNYGYVSRQANNGDSANNSLNDIKQNGLYSGQVKIKNNTNEEVIYNEHGILCRSYDDITETYSPKQLKLTHNIIALTDDAWKTVRQVIGEHEVLMYNPETNDWIKSTGYGMTADFVNAGWVIGSIIVGGTIISENYSDGNGKPKAGSMINLKDGTISLGAGGLTYDSENGLVVNKTAKVHSEAIVGKVLGSQIQSISSIQISDKVTSDKIESIEASQITGAIKADSVDASDINGVIAAEQIDSVHVSQITGVIEADTVKSENIDGIIESNQIVSTLNYKTLNGIFNGNATLSSLAVSYQSQNYTGITKDVEVGGVILKFINGILVDVS